jgi:hypothetical protein
MLGTTLLNGKSLARQVRDAVSTPPSLSDFTTAVRETFSFLVRFGFQEVAAPAHRAGDPYQLWFGAGDRFVVVAGEGYGTMASVTLEHDGRELSEIYLVPVDERPLAGARRKQPAGQLEQLREAAGRLERYGADFLGGDLSRFNEKAKPLPPYKSPPSEGRAG